MKRTFQQLYVDFPQATHEFSLWMLTNYKIREADYDDSISEHRYIIACRFLGESTDLPIFLNAEALENKIVELFERYEKAIATANSQDPLKELSNLDWETRNKMTEKSFTRRINPSLSDSLKPLTNFRFPGLSDALIPWKGRSSEFDHTVPAVSSANGNHVDHQMWLDNIKWCWDFHAGFFEIPF